ncbi:MAG: aminoglycoside phosphotransferase [Alphaproteobacteria bacterium]
MTDARVRVLSDGSAGRTAPKAAALAASLRRAEGFAAVTPEDIEALPVRGLQHRLYRVRGIRREGAGVLLRVPRQSHWGLPPADNLDYQAESFRRARLSEAVPRLFAILAPSAELPWGALAVEEIVGHAPRLPEEAPALCDALLAIHMLAVPEARAPLIDQLDPLAAMLATIENQARALEGAGLSVGARRQIEEELAWAQAYGAEHANSRQFRTLIMTDTQPGNFVVDARGRARCVDLEKAVYGTPAIDLAHATIYPSGMWDPAVAWSPEDADIAAFYRRYLAHAPEIHARELRRVLAPFRRLTWLRTITIFARMAAAARKRDWSGFELEPAFRNHALAHIADCHDEERLREMRGEWLDRGGLDALL